MKVSVVVPVYNKAEFLRECFESIFNQTFTDMEVIAVDDRSTDNSLEVLRSFTDPRLKVVELEKNLGPAGAAQRAMDLAIGKYIVRQDADDIMYADRIAQQVRFMDSRPEIGASGGQVRLFGKEEEEWSYVLESDACRALLLFGVPVAQGAAILRTEVLRTNNVRYQDNWPNVGEDWLYWTNLAKYTDFANLPSPLISYRRGDHNQAHGRDKASDYRFLLSQIFRSSKVDHTEEDIELHLLGLRVFIGEPNKDSISKLREWYDNLIAQNGHLHFAPTQEFNAVVEKQWESLFYFLPAFGFSAAWAHLFASSNWNMSHLKYLVKYCLKTMLGSRSNG